MQSLEHYPTRGFQSSTSTDPVFALQEESSVTLEVIWPNGKTSTMKIDQFDDPIEIAMNEVTLEQRNVESKAPLVRNISKEHDIDYNHYENYYDDYKDQVLLPHQLSNLGPALAVGDVNNDGLDDFFIGSAVGYYPALYMQDQTGKFKIQKATLLKKSSVKKK